MDISVGPYYNANQKSCFLYFIRRNTMSVERKYPLLLKPVIKDYLWGGTRLKTEFGFIIVCLR